MPPAGPTRKLTTVSRNRLYAYWLVRDRRRAEASQYAERVNRALTYLRRLLSRRCCRYSSTANRCRRDRALSKVGRQPRTQGLVDASSTRTWHPTTGEYDNGSAGCTPVLRSPTTADCCSWTALASMFRAHAAYDVSPTGTWGTSDKGAPLSPPTPGAGGGGGIVTSGPKRARAFVVEALPARFARAPESFAHHPLLEGRIVRHAHGLADSPRRRSAGACSGTRASRPRPSGPRRFALMTHPSPWPSG
jgi:hypothetical protein